MILFPGGELPLANTLYLKKVNFIIPYVTNGLSCPYKMGMFTFIFRGIRSNISFSFHFSSKFLLVNRIAPDGTPRFAASHLGLFCMTMSHKKDASLIWVKTAIYHLIHPLKYYAHGGPTRVNRLSLWNLHVIIGSIDKIDFSVLSQSFICKVVVFVGTNMFRYE